MDFKLNDKVIKAAIDKAEKVAMTSSCEVVLSQAKELVNVDTSKLKDEMFYTVEEVDGGLVGTVGSPTEYAEEQEFDKQKGSPYLRPAFRMNKENIANFFAREIRSEVEK